MIELTHIMATDTLWQLRGQINRMQNKIMTDQPMIGRCMNIIGGLYSAENLVASLPVFKNDSTLFALIFPENNKCFVAGFIGKLVIRGTSIPTCQFDNLSVRISGIKTPDGTVYQSFLSPSHLGLTNKPSTTTEEYHIGFNSTISGSEDMRNPFIDAYIKTSVDNQTNLLGLSLTAPNPINMNSKTIITLNF